MANQPLLDKELIAQIKSIQLRASHLVTASFAGEYESAFKGRGMEFDEVRQYCPGDDIRAIDWNVTARSAHPYVKVFQDERELTVMFMVDVSASSHFGSGKKFKNEVAAEITGLLAYLALMNNDKVGLIIFSDHVEHYIPPKKGRGHIWRLIREILSYNSKARKTDLNVPLEFLNRVIKHKAITFLISDFQGVGHEKQLKTVARHHEVIALSITDPREIELPNIGYIELEDAETGEFMLVNSSNLKMTGNLKKVAKKRGKDLKDFFLKSGIDYVEVMNGENYINPVIEYFRAKERKKK
jgi:uncharacterized protein (DUF58 family)